MINCDVKLLVAATPISGPQFIPITMSDSLERVDVIELIMEIILQLFFFAIFTASKTSALSPLWDIAITIELGSRLSGENCNSLEIIGSDLIFAYFAKRYFATSEAL